MKSKKPGVDGKDEEDDDDDVTDRLSSEDAWLFPVVRAGILPPGDVAQTTDAGALSSLGPAPCSGCT